jgi:hypothetical protein
MRNTIRRKRNLTKEMLMRETENGIKPLPVLKRLPKYGKALVPLPKVKMVRKL